MFSLLFLLGKWPSYAWLHQLQNGWMFRAPSLVSDAVVVSYGWHVFAGLVWPRELSSHKRSYIVSCKSFGSLLWCVFCHKFFLWSSLRLHRRTERHCSCFQEDWISVQQKELRFWSCTGFELHSSITNCWKPLFFFFFYFLSGYGNPYLVRLLGGWSQGILCLSNSYSVWIFPSFHLFNSNSSSRKNQQGLESRTIETSSPPLIWRDFGWDSGDLGDQALKDFMKESVVGLRRHFSKAADSPLNFTVKLEKPS